jgi:hypothetical protein
MNPTHVTLGTVLSWALSAAVSEAAPVASARIEAEVSASSTAPGWSAAGPIDGDRFSVRHATCWRGAAGAKTWWWQIRFAKPRPIGAILQIHGDRPSIFANAPRDYVWQTSDDGQSWQDLKGTETRGERRLFRLHRLAQARPATYLRLSIQASQGEAPTLREVELYAEATARIAFPDWIIAVSTTTENPRLPGETDRFVALARQCPGWENVLAQQLWLGDCDEGFCAAEPHPLCAFLSGNFLDWCQQAREPWRGVQEVLKARNLPIWASCGGAQGLAILQETGVDRPWDCPRCRDPKSPKLPVYSHIGHTGPSPCGDYTKCIAERGRFKMQRVAQDPVFRGLPDVFEAMESHVGQIAYVPPGWVRVVANGPGALTENQCLRLKDRYVYAAQFHVEMAGTPENSRTIMGNFLRLARDWGGYNPRGKPVPLPEPIASPKSASR